MSVKEIGERQLGLGALEHLNRRQEVQRCWRRENGEWVLKGMAFTEDWDETKKNSIVRELKKNLREKGKVFAYLDRGRILAVASVGGKLFGRTADYAELQLITVSAELRGMGVGRALFGRCAAFAKELGADKLYISGHSSEETQAFYKAMGCEVTHELNADLYYREPFDVHLEYDLKMSH